MRKFVIYCFNTLLLLRFTSMIMTSYATTVPITIPNPFVKLSEVAPTIIQSPRYAGTENFLGRPVPGYHSKNLICTRQAAIALQEVNAELNQKGYTLVVYDAYRPQRAVNAFIEWTTNTTDHVAKSHYYPTIHKDELFSLGYLAEQSSHSRGSTFDVTLIPIKQHLKLITYSSRTLSNGEVIPFLDDNTVDMGSSFDLFHPASHHDSPIITAEQTRMRTLLRDEMRHHGFAEVKEEWWHYTLIKEPYPDTYFDITID